MWPFNFGGVAPSKCIPPSKPKPIILDKPKEKIDRVTLYMHFIDNTETRFWQDGATNKVKTFLGFYDWWFNRDTPSYMFNCGDKMRMVKRDQIKTFSIEYEKVTK